MSDDFDYTYIEPLTNREMEVLHCLAASLSNKEIADKLVVEVSTVKWYNAQIYGKLQVKNRKQAVIRAHTLGILDSHTPDPLHHLQHNLPADTLPFIGRKDEIRELIHQLTQDKFRLISILGPGGMGKSRLSIEVGRRLLKYFRDGVYFAPLATVASAEQLVTKIADVVGFPFHSDLQPKQQLLKYLQNLHLLLIIDNFEHLLDSADLLMDILKIAPQVKILVTSREKLRLGGEATYAISGLSTEQDENVDALSSDAGKLFIEVATRTASHVDESESDIITRICQLLDGLPLGILLAASWTDTLSVEDIETEIQQGLGILEADLRDAPLRHRSIEAVFDTSWNRLTLEQQQIFMRLTVFQGGFTLGAAEAVANASIHGLKRLVHTSFIQHLPSRRYAIHELMRQYGEAQLTQSGGLKAIQERHAQYFVGFITPLANIPLGVATRKILEQVRSDFENVRAAWLFQAESRNIGELRRLLDGLWHFLDQYSRGQEAIDLFEPVLDIFRGNDDNETLFRGQVLARLAWFYGDVGQHMSCSVTSSPPQFISHRSHFVIMWFKKYYCGNEYGRAMDY